MKAVRTLVALTPALFLWLVVFAAIGAGPSHPGPKSDSGRGSLLDASTEDATVTCGFEECYPIIAIEILDGSPYSEGGSPYSVSSCTFTYSGTATETNSGGVWKVTTESPTDAETNCTGTTSWSCTVTFIDTPGPGTSITTRAYAEADHGIITSEVITVTKASCT